MIIVTRGQLRDAAPNGRDEIIKGISDYSGAVFSRYNLDSRNRILAFLSTVYEETGGFLRLEENLNYSAERLVQVWPSRFPTLAAAAPYAHRPELLADRVYGGRMGNVAPGDGWKFRGMGLLQCTGRDNFTRLEKLIGLPLTAKPEIVSDPDHMLEAAVALFCQFNGILGYCDAGNWRAVWALVGSGRPDGAVINLAAHQSALAALQRALLVPPSVNVPTPAPSPVPPQPLPLPGAVGPALPKPATSWWSLLWVWIKGR